MKQSTFCCLLANAILLVLMSNASLAAENIENVELALDSSQGAVCASECLNSQELLDVLKSIDRFIQEAEPNLASTVNGSVNSQHATIMTIMGLLIAITALATGIGVFISAKEVLAIRRAAKKNVSEIEKERESLVQSFNDMKSKFVLQADQSIRIIRLTSMLNNGIFDNEQFFVDLSQLAQHPSIEMLGICKMIKDDYSGKFEKEIHSLVLQILSRITA